MPDERPNERSARQVVAHVLGCPVELHDDGSAPAQVDAEILIDGRRVGMEIVADVSDQWMSQTAALTKTDQKIKVPGLRYRYILTISERARVDRVVSAAPDLLRRLEAGELDAPVGMWVPEEWEGVGIDHVTLVSSDSQPAGTVHLVGTAEARFVPDEFPAQAWINHLFDRHPDVPSKLRAYPSEEGHAFVWLVHSSDFDIEFMSASQPPSEPPVLPEGVTHLWIMPSWTGRSPLLWFPDRGWWEPGEIVMD